jgi:5-hydroxyisourate hydrolase
MTITTQVQDSVYGHPAAGVRARLERADGTDWTTISDAEANSEGSVEDWDSRRLERGLYRIVFDSDGYFASLGVATAYPEVVVIFRILDELHTFQVQVNLSPYSYSTYFGTVNSQPENPR